MKRIVSAALVLCLAVACFCLPAGAADMPYTDVPEGIWYYDEVQAAYDRGLMNGITTTEFGPDVELSRYMLVTILGRMAGVDASDADIELPFSDIPAGSWYGPYVAWAVELGLVQGYPDGTFGPDRPVTRQEAAAILGRYLEAKYITLEPVEDAVTDFADADQIADWAADEIQALAASGIFQGDENGVFAPDQDLPRCQAAAIFVRFQDALASGTQGEPDMAQLLLDNESMWAPVVADFLQYDSCEIYCMDLDLDNIPEFVIQSGLMGTGRYTYTYVYQAVGDRLIQIADDWATEGGWDSIALYQDNADGSLFYVGYDLVRAGADNYAETTYRVAVRNGSVYTETLFGLTCENGVYSYYGADGVALGSQADYEAAEDALTASATHLGIPRGLTLTSWDTGASDAEKLELLQEVYDSTTTGGAVV